MLAFFGSVLLIWIIGTRWLLFQGGAETLVNHPGLFNFDAKSPFMLKLLWVACLLGGIIGIIVLVTQEYTIPDM